MREGVHQSRILLAKFRIGSRTHCVNSIVPLLTAYLVGLVGAGIFKAKIATGANESAYRKAWVAAYILLILEFVRLATLVDSHRDSFFQESPKTTIAVEAIQVLVLIAAFRFLRLTLKTRI